MSRFTVIDLSQLPAPEIIETLDYEVIFERMKADLVATLPNLAEALEIESSPLTMWLQRSAYNELLLRGEKNDGAKSVMLAFATGAQLDHLAAFYGVARLVIDPGDATAAPPVEPTLESDVEMRRRVQLALEAQTTAGTVGAYEFFALSASPLVKDVAISQPTAGTVRITVLGRDGDGTPTQATLDDVIATLNDEDVRTLCFTNEIVAAVIQNFTVEATLTFYDGPDQAVVLAAAEAALIAYLEDRRLIGHDITISGLHAALHQPGVQNVQLTAPVADILIDGATAGYCTNVALVNGGVDV